MANFRPLQPAPMDQQEQPPPPPPPQGRPLLTQKPKRTVTLGACVACRKRKSKCDGARPTCTCCAQKDTECVYELGPNEKPSQAMKRKNEEMQGELSNLRQLYDFLRLRPEQEALEILRRIRANPPDTPPSQRIQELADFVRHGDLLIQPVFSGPSPAHQPSESLTLPPLRMALDSPNADPTGYPSSLPFPSNILSIEPEGPASQRRRHAADTDVSARSDSHSSLPPPTSIEAILSVPPCSKLHESADPRLALARKWTTITDDVSLIVHLMSAWHRWEYRYYHCLDWDIFLDDLSNGRTHFCSKLLVHALLASASFLSPMVKDRSKPFSDNIITQFYKEARRLWELEEGQHSLPRLQAALLLYLVLGKHGRDKVGHTFLVEACRIGRELGLFRLTPMLKPQGAPNDKWDRVRAVTSWALFNFQLVMSFTYSFEPILKTQPPLPIPYDDTPDYEALFRSECSRNIVMLDCSSTLWDTEIAESDIPPKPEQVEVLFLRLKSWWNSRPTSLDSTNNPSPENLLSIMLYHCSNIRLAQPFLSRDSSLERVKSYHSRAQNIFSTSIKELRRLLTLQENRHGWSTAIGLVLHPIMITSFGSLEEITRGNASQIFAELSEPYQGLLTCLRALSSLSSFIFYAQPLFRLLTQSCQTLGIRLPIEVMSTLDHYQSDQWTKNAASVVSSQYVADMRKVATDMDNGRMDTVIAQWDALTLGDKSGDASTRQDSEATQRAEG